MIRPNLGIAQHRLRALAARGMLVAALGAALAACETQKEEVVSAVDYDFRLRHPIQIVEKDRTLDVFVAEARGLLPDQRAAVLAFAQNWRDEGTGRFLIERPTNARNARATAVAVSEIRSILVAAGVPAAAIRVYAHRAPEKNLLAVVTLYYPRVAAEVTGCGQWPDDLGPSPEKKHYYNAEYWNFGCATRRNIAAMVAEPTDLVQPRAETPAFAARRSTVIDKYRKGEATATTYPNPDKGAISDLGK